MAETDDIVARLNGMITRDATGYTIALDPDVIPLAATALTEQAAQIERLTRDETRLRKALDECATYTGGHADGATVDFLMHVPENVRLHVERLTREVAKERDLHHTMMQVSADQSARATTAERERDEARAEVERKDAALLRVAKRCRRPDLVARAALEEDGKP